MLQSLDLIIAIAENLKAIKIKQNKLEEQIKVIEKENEQLKEKIKYVRREEFTIIGYANFHNMAISNYDINYLSRKAAKLSREKGYLIASTPHPIFGKVNTYHVDILDIVFDEMQLIN